jgi:hypothetical protein
MERLNSGRVFRISLPAEEAVRLWVAETDRGTRVQLRVLVRQAPAPDALGERPPPDLAAGFFALLEHAGTKLHNSFHTRWWRMEVDQTATVER